MRRARLATLLKNAGMTIFGYGTARIQIEYRCTNRQAELPVSLDFS